MPLRLKFQDKYRLWAELLRANTDRLFVPTDEQPKIGAKTPLELTLPGQTMPLILRGTVVGQRRKGPRFPAGAYLRISDDELEKCRRLLGLVYGPNRWEKTRKSNRAPCALNITYLKPDASGTFATLNLSETGSLVSCPSTFLASSQVWLQLDLEDGQPPLKLAADVSWTDPERNVAGLNFVDLDGDAAALARVRAVVKARQALAAARRDKLPIVVGDDDPSILTFLTAALSKHGYDVVQTRSGPEALSRIRELQPRLVILDILLPGIDGADVCKMMRADVDLVEIPVIFLSALEEEQLYRVADESGATDFLTKPVALTDLLNTIGAYLKA
jgi:CheY-like chemotaxis protein